MEGLSYFDTKIAPIIIIIAAVRKLVVIFSPSSKLAQIKVKAGWTKLIAEPSVADPSLIVSC